jgi:hypothetical protein
MLVPVFVTVTSAPGITVPVESVTMPVMETVMDGQAATLRAL